MPSPFPLPGPVRGRRAARRGARRGRSGRGLPIAGLLLAAALMLARAPATHAQTPAAQAQAPTGDAPAAGSFAARERLAELSYIESLYREQDDYRAESEVLRYLYNRPHDPQRPDVELLRAKLYYREGRYREADLMLYSLLDRHPEGAVADDARKLLTFSLLRQGRVRQAKASADALAGPGRPKPSLAALMGPPPGSVDVERAVTWSTWLPGSGFATLGEPGKAAVGLSLNLGLIGAAVLSAQGGNPPAALLFLVLEGMLWQGGRSGVREDAEAINRHLRERRTDDWIAHHGEARLMGVGLTLHFGGG